MPGPIGISFLPSDQQAANGPMQGSLEGDLGQALKILSLQLPRRPSVRGIAPPRLMNASPMAAVIQALLHAGGLSAGGGGGYNAGGGGYGGGGGVPGGQAAHIGAGNSPGGGTDGGAIDNGVGTNDRGPQFPTWTQPQPLGVDRSGGGGGGGDVMAGQRRRGPWQTY